MRTMVCHRAHVFEGIVARSIRVLPNAPESNYSTTVKVACGVYNRHTVVFATRSSKSWQNRNWGMGRYRWGERRQDGKPGKRLSCSDRDLLAFVVVVVPISVVVVGVVLFVVVVVVDVVLVLSLMLIWLRRRRFLCRISFL